MAKCDGVVSRSAHRVPAEVPPRQYPGDQELPRRHILADPIQGRLLARSNAGLCPGGAGLRKFFEEGGHELALTSDKDGPDSEFERELPDAPPAALEAEYYAQRRRLAAG
jgi:hypothetical protein